MHVTTPHSLALLSTLAWFAFASASLGGCAEPSPSPPDGGANGGLDAASVDGSTVDGGTPACRQASDCDDGVFCDGSERCVEGACVDGDAPCEAASCAEALEMCPGLCGLPDADGDGQRAIACGGDDCDDSDPDRFPGHPEVCDAGGHDEDCDPETYGFRDADGDGSPDARCCNDDGAGSTRCGDDCDDMRPGVNPDVPEVCNRRDDDCDTAVDEGVLRMFYTDADGDGFGGGPPLAACTLGERQSELGTDCDDTQDTVHPGAAERCDGTVDDSCNGSVDEGCDCVAGRTRECGNDLGQCTRGTQACIAGTWASCDGVSPVLETCNTADDDCDGQVDEGLRIPGCRADGDGDTFAARDASTGTVVESTLQCADPARTATGGCPAGYTNRPGPADCDDRTSAIFPGGTEVCNGLDDDCNGLVDDVAGAGASCAVGVGACVASGVRACAGVTLVCVGTAGLPGVEVCDAENVDEDCDGLVNEGLTSNVCRRDQDGDGVGTGAATVQCRDESRFAQGYCPLSYTNRADATDCNDLNASVRPGAAETCNGIDDNCDGVVDDGAVIAYFRDADGDTYGAGDPVLACLPPGMSGWATRAGDCDDGLAAVRPSAVELCDGARDENCSGTVDEGCTCVNGTARVCGSTVGRCTLGSQTCSAGTWGACSGTPPIGETCNGIDDNCSGTTDEGVTTSFYRDSDGDGFGAGTASAGCSPGPVGYVANNRDCNDGSAAVRPTATELCNGTDDDCDGLVDEMCSCTAGEVRACGSAVGLCTTGTQTCTGSGWTACSGIAPAAELCNGLDENCNGVADDGFPTTLSGLVASCGTLSPALSPSVTAYTVPAGIGSTSCTLSPTFACGTATVDGAPVASGGTSAPFPLAVGTTRVPVVLTNAAGATTYTVDVVRQRAFEQQPGGAARWSAAMSGDGSTVAYALPGTSSAGRVAVYRRGAAGVWTSEASLVPPFLDAGDQFGAALALSADGSVLAVGTPGDDSCAAGVGGDASDNGCGYCSPSCNPNGSPGPGAVWVFRRVGAVWSVVAYLKASNPNGSFSLSALAGDQFGTTLALSSDGTLLAVGAPFEDSAAAGVNGDQSSNAAGDAGAVYVFRASSTGVWTQEAYVKASNPGAGDNFGSALALSSDGTRLAVGAALEDGPTNSALNQGAVYVFAPGAGAWAQEALVVAANTQAGDRFGGALALSADGAVLAVGATLEDSDALGVGGDPAREFSVDSGAAYVFRRSASAWSQEVYLKASNTEAYDYFGTALALSADGAVLLVGAPREDSSALGVNGDALNNGALDTGAAYAYRRSTAGLWTLETYLKATASSSSYGSPLAMSADGNRIAACGDSSVYLYR